MPAGMTRSGAPRIAPMTSLNCSMPSLCRCANFAMSRRANVDCWCDGGQRKGRVANDPRAVAACDLAVHLGAIGLEPVAFDTLRRRANPALRLFAFG
jgi:hypothetical protein